MNFLPMNLFLSNHEEKKVAQETLAPINFKALQKMQNRKNGHKRLIEMLFQDVSQQPMSAANTAAAASKKVG